MKYKEKAKRIAAIPVAIMLLLWCCDMRLKTITYTVKTDKVEHKIRIVLLTDLHGCKYGKNQKTLSEVVSKGKPESVRIITGAPFFFAIFGLPFIAVGLYLLVGKFFYTAYMRKRTAYVITNKKIIRLRGKKIEMLDGKSLPVTHVEARLDGSGTIQFGEAIHYRRGGKHYADSRNVF